MIGDDPEDVDEDEDELETQFDAGVVEDPSTRSLRRGLVDPTEALMNTQLSHEPGPESSLAELGPSVGRYRILGLLGRGGMGVVLHAHDPDLERELAIKVLREQVDAPESARGRALLMREARAIARVSHPNVLAVHDVGVHQGRVYLVMELIRGRPLHHFMRDGHPLAELLEVFAQAGRGLAAAHTAGLVHRDFKPANVLVGEDGRVRVLDFGLARPPSESGDISAAPPGAALVGGGSLTIAGALAGTPAYMSPEQFEARDADPRSDQFSFCVALHEALFGIRPFVGETLFELRDAVTRRPLQLPGSAELLPMTLRELLFRGLAKHAADRFADMDAVVELLESLTDELALVDRRAAPLFAPLGFVPRSESSSTNRNLASSERLSSYLGELPRGLDSHPQCTMHGATLRLALARHPLDPERDELPDEVVASLEYLARADLEDPWIAEVPARVVLAAIFDRRVRSLRAWDELWFAIARSRFTTGFLGFATARDGPSLAASLARLWNDFHRGTTLELRPCDAGLALKLAYPPDLLDPLGHAEALQLVHAGLQMSGHEHFELRELEADSRHLQATIRYR